jgi:hypothetical protein
MRPVMLPAHRMCRTSGPRPGPRRRPAPGNRVLLDVLVEHARVHRTAGPHTFHEGPCQAPGPALTNMRLRRTLPEYARAARRNAAGLQPGQIARLCAAPSACDSPRGPSAPAIPGRGLTGHPAPIGLAAGAEARRRTPASPARVIAGRAAPSSCAAGPASGQTGRLTAVSGRPARLCRRPGNRGAPLVWFQLVPQAGQGPCAVGRSAPHTARWACSPLPAS